DVTFFVTSKFHLFSEELVQKNWPNKKFVESGSFIKSLLNTTQGRLKNRKMGGMTLFVIFTIYLFFEELAQNNWPNKKCVEPNKFIRNSSISMAI
ncbi:MAG: hypothetical protein RSB44_15000, partial [Carnobacterium sp.]